MHKLFQIVLAILTVLSGCAFWFLLGAKSISAFGILPLYAVIDLVLFLTFLGITFIFLDARISSLVIFLSLAPLIFVFGNTYLALALVAGASLLSYGPATKIRKEERERLDFSVWDILRKGLPTFLTIFALTLAIFFYPKGNAVMFEDIIPESFFQKVVTSIDNIFPIGSFLPFSIPDPKQSVDQVLIEAIRAEASETWDNLPKEDQEKILADARRELGKNLGISEVNGKGEIGKVLYRSSIELLEERFGAYRRYLPAVFALAVFASFRTLFIFFGLLSIALVWIIIKILLYFNVLKIAERQVTQEVIEVK